MHEAPGVNICDIKLNLLLLFNLGCLLGDIVCRQSFASIKYDFKNGITNDDRKNLRYLFKSIIVSSENFSI